MEKIERIRVFCSEVTMQAAAKLTPKTGLEGKFSVPYCVANALLRDVTGMAAFTDEMVQDPAVKALTAKVELQKDPQKTALEATVEIVTRDGRTFSAFSDILQKIPPLEKKQQNVRAKFLDLAGPVIGAEKAVKIADAVAGLEKVADMRQIAGGL